jgi:hypothetical protein
MWARKRKSRTAARLHRLTRKPTAVEKGLASSKNASRRARPRFLFSLRPVRLAKKNWVMKAKRKMAKLQ